MTSIQKVFQQRKKPVSELESEQFEKNQNIHISKAINSIEGAPKEKHIRGIILGTFHYGGAYIFFKHTSLHNLQSNPIICWKYLYVVHKIMRDGHEQALIDVIKNEKNTKELGDLWSHLKTGYGVIISKFCKLLIQKNKFHKKYRRVPGNLIMQNDEIFQFGKNIDGLFELGLDILDYLQELVSFEKSVVDSLDKSKSNSTTPQGQCRLTPLIQVIQDMATLYDISVRILFRLHSKLDIDLLSGHRQRFLKLFEAIKLFFKHAQTFQYFKTLVQVPTLPENPPNFMIESDLVAQKALVVNVTEEPDNDINVFDCESPTEINNTLIDFNQTENNEKFDKLFGEMDAFSFNNDERNALQKEIDYLKALIERMKAEHREKINSLLSRIRVLEEEVKGLVQLKDQYEEKLRQYEMQKNDSVDMEKFNKIKDAYSKLRDEHLKLLRQHGINNQQILTNKNELESIQKQLEDRNIELAKLEKENLLYASMEKNIDQYNQELAEAQAKLKEIERSKFEALAKNKNLDSKNADLLKQIEDLQRESDKEKQLDTEKYKKIEQETFEAQNSLKKSLSQINELGNVIRTLEEKLRQENELRLEMSGIYDNIVNAACRTSIDLIDKTYHKLNTEDLSRCRATPDMVKLSILDVLTDIKEIQHFVSTGINSSKERMQLADTIYKFGSKLCDTLYHTKVMNNDSDNLFDQIKEVFYRVYDQSKSLLDSIQNQSDVDFSSFNLLDTLNRLIQLSDQVKSNNLVLENETTDDLFDEELRNTRNAIELAVNRFNMILEQSRSKFSGIKLEVNEKILESCNELMYAIKVLIDRSKDMQIEIVAEGKGTGSITDFYKKHHKWTEGLISAAKSVGGGATWLCEAADNLLTKDGKFEVLMICSREITASTTQLVVSSRVKANLTSVNFQNLSQASREVSVATGKVIANAENAMNVLKEQGTYNFSNLTLTQAKRLEMDSQVRVLELENDLEKERRRLGELRKKHYQLAGETMDENEAMR